MATFNRPSAVLALGSVEEGESVVYVADAANHCVRIITTPRSEELSVGTLAGQPGLSGLTDGPLNESLFGTPAGLALAADGALLVSDSTNNNVRRVCLATRSVTTLAGALDRAWGFADGDGGEAQVGAQHEEQPAAHGERRRERALRPAVG